MRADARAVVDTNVLISAILLRDSVPALVVRHLLRQGTVIFSEATFAEFEQRLWRPKFDRYVSIDLRRALLRDWASIAEWVEVGDPLPPCSRDPQDDKFIHAAITGRADLLISGDLDLLDLGSVQSVPIMRAAAAWDLLRG
jgi:uncharacterized protein